MENKVYPAFYESQDGSVYLYQNKNGYYSYIREEWDKSSPSDAHGLDKNITHEFLANTYGEVKSKEHAEFIVRLAETNKIQAVNPWREGLLFCFYYNSDGDLILAFYPEKSAKSDGEKQITIPLPPECESKKPNKEDIKEYLMNQGLSPLSAGETGDSVCECIEVQEFAMQHGDEWPKVGDEVLLSDKLNSAGLDGFIGEVCKVIGICFDGENKVLTIKNGNHIASLYDGGWVKKPKTPEQELFESFWKEVGLFINQSNLDKRIFESAFINNITKKGEGDE